MLSEELMENCDEVTGICDQERINEEIGENELGFSFLDENFYIEIMAEIASEVELEYAEFNFSMEFPSEIPVVSDTVDEYDEDILLCIFCR
jgi:hypothetical protein